MSCYVIAQLQIHDWDTYRQYQSGFLKMFEGYDGEVLIVDDAPQVMEGEWRWSRTAVIRFASRQEAERWYQSPEYQELIRKYRLPSSSGNLIFAKGLK